MLLRFWYLQWPLVYRISLWCLPWHRDLTRLLPGISRKVLNTSLDQNSDQQVRLWRKFNHRQLHRSSFSKAIDEKLTFTFFDQISSLWMGALVRRGPWGGGGGFSDHVHLNGSWIGKNQLKSNTVDSNTDVEILLHFSFPPKKNSFEGLGWASSSHGRVFSGAPNPILDFFSVWSLNILRGWAYLARQSTDGLDSIFSEFPGLTQSTRPQNSSSRAIEYRVLHSILLEVFPTWYSTWLDLIFVEEVCPSANSPMAGLVLNNTKLFQWSTSYIDSSTGLTLVKMSPKFLKSQLWVKRWSQHVVHWTSSLGLYFYTWNWS